MSAIEQVVEFNDLTFKEQLAVARDGGPAEWSKLMNPQWAVPAFVRGISDQIKDEIERAQRTKNGGIILFSMPPGHNKSYLASENTPEWFLENNQDKRLAIVAYGATRAQEWGEEIRNAIEENPDKFTVRLRRDTKSKARFRTEQGGGVLCTGVGGPLTGFRAHFIVVDDPVKDDEEAQSELIREKQWAWFRKVALTRRWPEATTMVVMCVAEGERVCMADGTWRPIETVQAGDFVVGHESGAFHPRKVVAQRCSGDDDILEVSTRRGRRSVRVNARHPFLMADGRWVKAGDLQPGDEVRVLDSIPWGEDSDEEFAWLFGVMIGDGWVTSWQRNNHDRERCKTYTSRSWCVCHAEGIDPEHNAEVRRLLEKHLGGNVKSTRFGYCRMDCNEAGRKLERLGIHAGVGALGKRIPAWIFAASEAVKVAFLRGYAAADGHKLARCIDSHRIVSNNQAIIEDTRFLAMECGVTPGKVVSQQITNQPPHSHEPMTTTLYSISLNFAKRSETDLIENVTPAGVSNVYDLTVQGAESFVAEGFVVHNTRWHEDDLVGKIIQLYKEAEKDDALDELPPIKIIRIPCIAEDDDPIGRPRGAMLWPEAGYDEKWAKQTKRLVGSHTWTTMYQQRPTPEGGGMFRSQDFRYFHHADDGSLVLHHDLDDEERIQPTSTWRAQIGDTAMKTKTVNDWTVIGTFGITRKRQLLVLNIERVRIEVPDQLPFIRQQMAKWRPRWTAIEDVGGGTVVIQEARRQGIMLRPIKPVLDKVTRAAPASALMEQNQIFFLRDAPWLEEFEKELQGFPNAAHDDQVDVLAHMVRELAGQAGYSTSRKRPRRQGLAGLNDGGLH